MTRLGDSLSGLTAFVRSVDHGGFSAAARHLGTSPSAVSKAVAKLEDRVGVLLLRRSTRKLQLTAEGFSLYERGTRIVEELRAAETELRESRGPRGLVRVSAPLDLGRHWLVPLVPAFLARYPHVCCEVDLSDRFVDLAGERFDVAIRMGEHATPDTMRKKLGPTTSLLCASPSYLRKHGVPRTPADLAEHDCLTYVRDGRPVVWHISEQSLEVTGPFSANNHDALLAMALSGAGIVRLPSFMARPHLKSHKLRVVLGAYTTHGPFAYVTYPERRHVAPRVKAFAEFVAQAFARAPA